MTHALIRLMRCVGVLVWCGLVQFLATFKHPFFVVRLKVIIDVLISLFIKCITKCFKWEHLNFICVYVFVSSVYYYVLVVLCLCVDVIVLCVDCACVVCVDYVCIVLVCCIYGCVLSSFLTRFVYSILLISTCVLTNKKMSSMFMEPFTSLFGV
jgi:hypothetical protein